MIINCLECGKEISDKSTACIGCGFPISPIEVDTLIDNTVPDIDEKTVEIVEQVNLDLPDDNKDMSEYKVVKLFGFKKGKLAYKILSIFSLISVIALTLFLMSNKKGEINFELYSLFLLLFLLTPWIMLSDWKLTREIHNFRSGITPLSVVLYAIIMFAVSGILTRNSLDRNSRIPLNITTLLITVFLLVTFAFLVVLLAKIIRKDLSKKFFGSVTIIILVGVIIIGGINFYNTRWERYFKIEYIGSDDYYGSTKYTYLITNNTNKSFTDVKAVFRVDCFYESFELDQNLWNFQAGETKEASYTWNTVESEAEKNDVWLGLTKASANVKLKEIKFKMVKF